MSRMKSLCFLVVAVGCTEPGESPPPNPPPPWGVPISGGNLIVTRDGAHAVIADPDRDRILGVELASGRVVAEIPLRPLDEPGRLIEDGAGRIHVALRRGGALVTLASATSTEPAQRRSVCAEPRGLAWDAAHDAIHVACATGELVSLSAAGGEPIRSLRLERDLRDVVVAGDRLIATRFRTAEVLTLDAQGAIVDRKAPPPVTRFASLPDLAQQPAQAIPAVAWRTIALPDGRLVISHQRQRPGKLETSDGGYGGGCDGGPVEAALSVVGQDGTITDSAPTVTGALPVDIAVDRTGTRLAIVVAGDESVQVVSTQALERPDRDECGFPHPGERQLRADLGAPTSVAWTPADELVVFYPELPAIVVEKQGIQRTIELPGPVGYDAGRALFHRQTPLRLACASCHPEGREDGLRWDFSLLGVRRTQSLGGHILQRAPYHWGGDMRDLSTLMDDVFGRRMAGGQLSASERRSLGPWLDRIPAPASAPAADADAAARGQALFDSVQTGCTTCHAGPLLTNNQLANVGTGGPIKVPSLVGVGARAPFMHTGCAATLADRFSDCGGNGHGTLDGLTPAQLSDLAVYLDSL